MPNENCLAGIRCLNCGSEGPFKIHCMSWFEVHDDGTEGHEEVEWHDGSSCLCIMCSCLSTVGENRVENQERAKAQKEMEK